MTRHLILFAFAAALPLAGMVPGGLPGMEGSAQASPLAAERPVLRGKVTATRALLTIADFFENPGPNADQPLFRAPDLGRTGTVPALDVLRRARAAGLTDADTSGVRDVIVHRAALTIGPDQLRRMIREALQERTGIDASEDLEIEYSGDLPTLTADPAALEPVKLARLSYSPHSGRFDAVFSVDLDKSQTAFAVAGLAIETASIVTFSRRLSRGDMVTAHDLETTRVPRTALREGTVTDPDDIIGMAVRRAQMPGRVLVKRDFEEPIAVERRSRVIITYEISGLKLTVQGEAMADAVKGDVIDVLNIQSRRTIQAVVTGPGRVSVQPRTARVASLEEHVK
ncbi:flagella basal body P-ring formation protein FlgA [Breoghania corrubedonensis]|uniref:Flagella basal body P-ring formation protein FlgA n=1 Tax=Breoghania corrubedonensis TaxID=665038 RepID=A0A2T5VDD2_9HYPH|nr:flagellar basal body P-ring formation chaperone FlgA [Breoghania corrubedonensis]PTW61777.1 flagella basal body P-ring formation protein FlgA [Breoghania corrubedonensis]